MMASVVPAVRIPVCECFIPLGEPSVPERIIGLFFLSFFFSLRTSVQVRRRRACVCAFKVASEEFPFASGLR